MEILKLIFAFLLYTVFIGVITGIFCYCIACNTEDMSPDDESF